MVLTSQKARKYATFWYLFIFLRHQTDRLNVFRPREHIHRLALLCPVAMLCEIQKIPRQRLRIAGNVNDTLRCQRHHRGEERLIASGARRIHEDDIHLVCSALLSALRIRAVFRHLYHELSRVCVVKFDIFDVVTLRIFHRIAHGIAV